MTSPFRPPSFPADPTGRDLDAMWAALAPEPGTGGPTICGVFISTIDGRTAVDGRSGALGTPTDSLVFHAMRARADLVVAGARTAVADDYGPPEVDPRWAAHRGSSTPPRLVLLAHSVSEGTLAHVLRRGPEGFTVVVPDGCDGVDRAVRAGVDVVARGTDPANGLRDLAAELGATEVVCEGGPSVFRALSEADQLDELVHTTSPRADFARDAGHVAPGPSETTRAYRVAASFSAHDGGLYTRWVRDRGTGADAA